MAVQCKHESKPLGVGHVREFHGALAEWTRTDPAVGEERLGILASTEGFTASATQCVPLMNSPSSCATSMLLAPFHLAQARAKQLIPNGAAALDRRAQNTAAAAHARWNAAVPNHNSTSTPAGLASVVAPQRLTAC